VRVLVTEDDDDLLVAVEVSLRSAGFAVDVAADLPDADLALDVNAYDCAVFDRMLPSGDALPYVARRRFVGWQVPVLFLTGRDSVADRIDGLANGDDYLVKPFAMVEMVARVRSLCRRSGVAPTPVLRRGDLELDPGRHEARRAGVPLDLTGKQFTVLACLLAADGEPVHRDDLIAAAWDEVVPPKSNVLEVVIAQLRAKLGPPPLVRTVRGVGYAIR
jgi:two-component system, OmpR family, response regulator